MGLLHSPEWRKKYVEAFTSHRPRPVIVNINGLDFKFTSEEALNNGIRREALNTLPESANQGLKDVMNSLSLWEFAPGDWGKLASPSEGSFTSKINRNSSTQQQVLTLTLACVVAKLNASSPKAQEHDALRTANSKIQRALGDLIRTQSSQDSTGTQPRVRF